MPANHPLRKIRELVRDVLSEMNRQLGKLYASEGRPSIPPEQLLSALLLQVFYGVRSERQLMEQLDYNLLYRWFVGLSPDNRSGTRPFHQEPRPAAERRGVCKVHDQAFEPSTGQAAIVGRAFFGGRNADRSWACRSFVPRMAAATMITARISMARSARTTPMPAQATPTAGFIAKPPDGRRSFAIWATPPWRTGMVWRWPAGHKPMAQPNAGPRRSC